MFIDTAPDFETKHKTYEIGIHTNIGNNLFRSHRCLERPSHFGKRLDQTRIS